MTETFLIEEHAHPLTFFFRFRRKFAAFAVRNRHERCQKACQSHGPNKKNIFVRCNPHKFRHELHWKRYLCSDCWKCKQINKAHKISIQYWYHFGLQQYQPPLDQAVLRSLCSDERDSEVDEIFVYVQRGHICSIPEKRPTVPGKTKNTDTTVAYDRALLAVLAGGLSNSNDTIDIISRLESSDTDINCTEFRDPQPKYWGPSPMEYMSSLEPVPKRRKLMDEIDLLFLPDLTGSDIPATVPSAPGPIGGSVLATAPQGGYI